MKRKDGGFVWVETDGSLINRNGQPARVTGVISDIDDQKKTEAALRRSEETYRLLVENANDAIFLLQDGKIKFANRRARIIGDKLGVDLNNVPFADYIHPEDRNIIVERHHRRMKGETLPGSYASRLVVKEGREMWVEINTVKVNWKGKLTTLNALRAAVDSGQFEIDRHRPADIIPESCMKINEKLG